MASERIQRRIDILLDEADEAFAQRNWETVQQRAQDTLALDPVNQDAITLLPPIRLDASGATTGELASSHATNRAPATSSETSTGGTDLPSGLITCLFTDVQGSRQ
ncbi:MAG: hypothetical protein V3T78_07840 [Dehalococcoidia bacterium]